MKGKIIIVDDDSAIRKVLHKYFESKNYTVLEDDGSRVLKKVETFSPEVVLLDVFLHGHNRLDLLEDIKHTHPGTEVIIMTGQSSYQVAVDAIKKGAREYLIKPVDLNLLEKLVSEVIEEKTRRFHKAEKKDEVIIGKSKTMQSVFVKIGKASILDVPVLITGETGTGKELVAKAIHRESGKKNFVAINCSSIPSTLLETELFGFEKGAFSGADRTKKGLIELAQDGTLFLDEIGDMPVELQAKLLRVLEEKEFYRIGSEKKVNVNFRLICATNQNLEEKIKNGEFRNDLYYRISTFTIFLPPLRERKEDIPELVSHFITLSNKEYKTEITGIDSDALKMLMEYNFPGNVRELQNIIRTVVIEKKRGVISKEDLKEYLKSYNTSAEDISEKIDSLLSSKRTLPELVKYIERKAIETALKKTNGNKQKTAQLLGIHRNTLFKKMKELGIK